MMPVILDRYCPQGHIDFLPLSMPSTEVSHAVAIKINQDYRGVEIAGVDSNYKFAAYLAAILKVYFLGNLGVLRGIYPSFEPSSHCSGSGVSFGMHCPRALTRRSNRSASLSQPSRN